MFRPARTVPNGPLRDTAWPWSARRKKGRCQKLVPLQYDPVSEVGPPTERPAAGCPKPTAGQRLARWLEG